jgi:hypothetical protein
VGDWEWEVVNFFSYPREQLVLPDSPLQKRSGLFKIFLIAFISVPYTNNIAIKKNQILSDFIKRSKLNLSKYLGVLEMVNSEELFKDALKPECKITLTGEPSASQLDDRDYYEHQQDDLQDSFEIIDQLIDSSSSSYSLEDILSRIKALKLFRDLDMDEFINDFD